MDTEEGQRDGGGPQLSGKVLGLGCIPILSLPAPLLAHQGGGQPSVLEFGGFSASVKLKQHTDDLLQM